MALLCVFAALTFLCTVRIRQTALDIEDLDMKAMGAGQVRPACIPRRSSTHNCNNHFARTPAQKTHAHPKTHHINTATGSKANVPTSTHTHMQYTHMSRMLRNPIQHTICKMYNICHVVLNLNAQAHYSDSMALDHNCLPTILQGGAMLHQALQHSW